MASILELIRTCFLQPQISKEAESELSLRYATAFNETLTELIRLLSQNVDQQTMTWTDKFMVVSFIKNDIIRSHLDTWSDELCLLLFRSMMASIQNLDFQSFSLAEQDPKRIFANQLFSTISSLIYRVVCLSGGTKTQMLTELLKSIHMSYDRKERQLVFAFTTILKELLETMKSETKKVKYGEISEYHGISSVVDTLGKSVSRDFVLHFCLSVLMEETEFTIQFLASKIQLQELSFDTVSFALFSLKIVESGWKSLRLWLGCELSSITELFPIDTSSNSINNTTNNFWIRLFSFIPHCLDLMAKAKFARNVINNISGSFLSIAATLVSSATFTSSGTIHTNPPTFIVELFRCSIQFLDFPSINTIVKTEKLNILTKIFQFFGATLALFPWTSISSGNVPIPMPRDNLPMWFENLNPTRFCLLIMERYMPITGEEIEAWQENPDDFLENELIGSKRTFSKAVIAIYKHHLQRICPFALLEALSSLISNVCLVPNRIDNISSTGSLETLLKWDGGLASLCYASQTASRIFQFADFYDKPRLLLLFNGNSILVKRTLQFVREWADTIQMGSQLENVIQSVVSNIGHQDIVVSFYACSALTKIVNLLGKQNETIISQMPALVMVIEQAIEAICRLIRRTESAVVHSQLCSLMQLLLKLLQRTDRLKMQLQSISNVIMELWEDVMSSPLGANGSIKTSSKSDRSNRQANTQLCCELLRLLAIVVQVSGNPMWSTLSPVLMNFTDISRGYKALLADSLLLWKTCLEQSPPWSLSKAETALIPNVSLYVLATGNEMQSTQQTQQQKYYSTTPKLTSNSIRSESVELNLLFSKILLLCGTNQPPSLVPFKVELKVMLTRCDDAFKLENDSVKMEVANLFALAPKVLVDILQSNGSSISDSELVEQFELMLMSPFESMVNYALFSSDTAAIEACFFALANLVLTSPACFVKLMNTVREKNYNEGSLMGWLVERWLLIVQAVHVGLVKNGVYNGVGGVLDRKSIHLKAMTRTIPLHASIWSKCGQIYSAIVRLEQSKMEEQADNSNTNNNVTQTDMNDLVSQLESLGNNAPTSSPNIYHGAFGKSQLLSNFARTIEDCRRKFGSPFETIMRSNATKSIEQ